MPTVQRFILQRFTLQGRSGFVPILLLALCLGSGFGVGLVAKADAAPLSVADCSAAVGDEASLAAAITCINTAVDGTHTIALTADIGLTQPLPTLSNSLVAQVTIDGNGHAIQANGLVRVLAVESVQNLLLRNLTLTGGNSTADDLAPNGGGLLLTCGEDVVCTFTLVNTVVEGNQAASGGGIAYYCGYHGGGELVIEDSVLRDNGAVEAGGGLFYSSDEESFECAVTVRNTVIEGNLATSGAGVRILRPRVTIEDSTIRNNTANEDGGGLLARISDGFITLTVRNSTVSGNEAGRNGGGVYIESPDQTFEIQFVNSTISGNMARGGKGGGLYLSETFDSLRILLLNSTVTQNAGAQGAGVHIFHGDDGLTPRNTLTLHNTLVADNGGADCAGESSTGGAYTGQQVISNGHNLDSDGTCLTADVRLDSDIPSGNALLGPLAANGGPTLTHLLLPGSDALDAGDTVACTTDPVGSVDQRGVTRPQGAACDIGAVEMQPARSLIVTKFDDSNDGACDTDCSLREAIAEANTYPGPDQIILSTGTYTLSIPGERDEENDRIDEDDNAIGDLDIADGLTIVGVSPNDTRINGGGVDRVFEILADVQARIERLTIANGHTSETGGGLSNSGTLELYQVYVLGNRAASGFSIGHGGGIFNDGLLTIVQSIIANNHAAGGEASYGQGGGIRNDGALTVVDTNIRDNSVSDDNDWGIGGGIVNQGILSIVRSTLSSNSTPRGPGGALANRFGGLVEIINSTISGNSAGLGGGIANGDTFDPPGRVLLLHVTIANNEGGGLYNGVDGLTTSTNTIIAGNVADTDGNPAGQNCFNEGTFTSEGATVLDNAGNCPSTGPGDQVVDATTVFTTLLDLLANNPLPPSTHALLPGSPAIDAATEAGCADERVAGVDQRGVTRPQGAGCDIGAYEAEVDGEPTQLLFLSSSSSATAGGVHFRDEDIFAYDLDAETWIMVFDGSDVGITKDVDAFAFDADGALLLSFNGATQVPGLGAVDDSDIVRFTPTALGETTAGSFTLYLRGADVGLTTDSEDIDAIDFTADGRLVISTIGNVSTPTVTARDEDLLVLNDAVFGNPSSGSWSLFFDGSTVDLANEDINGLWIDPATSEHYFTVKDSFAFDGQSIDSDDIFICLPTPKNGATGCAYSLFWDSDEQDYGSENIDGLDIGPMPATYQPPSPPLAPAQVGDEDPAADEDADDLDVIEGTYLPFVVQGVSD
jgi:CSLREA domain-containing protein